MADHLSRNQARRAALAAQGFGERRPGAAGSRVDRRHFRRVVERLGAVQIDSVNVIVRAHELTFFARLGPYARPALADWLHRSGEVFEYWGHAASFLPVELHPPMRWKMAEHRAKGSTWRPDYVEEVRRLLRERGPLVPSDLAGDGDGRREPWWGWDAPKRALEILFLYGDATAVRNPRFERVYDIPERVLPAAVLDGGELTAEEARRALLLRAARAMGVATERDLSDYFRLTMTKARPALRSLVEDGALVPVEVEGWPGTAYRHPEASVPARMRARALLAPFDSLVWERDRAERVFDFRYRIEIYTPAARRVHGYYVLPFLLGDRLVGRVDVKADRQAGALLARASWAEPGVDPGEVADELADELSLMAGWLGLERVEVSDRGDLAPALRRAVER